MSPTGSDPAVERYLDQVRASLHGMPETEIDEIVLELRGHIAERLGEGSDAGAALHSLGDPAALAREYRTDRVTTHAECTASPIAVLHSLLLLRRGSFTGWLVLAVAAFGYAWALALGGASIEKILSPRDVGLWYTPGALSMPRLMIDGPGPAGTRELLGWWFVPLALAAGAILFLLTRQLGLWRIRRFRETRVR
jgi:HAAS domain-containing protein